MAAFPAVRYCSSSRPSCRARSTDIRKRQERSDVHRGESPGRPGHAGFARLDDPGLGVAQLNYNANQQAPEAGRRARRRRRRASRPPREIADEGRRPPSAQEQIDREHHDAPLRSSPTWSGARSRDRRDPGAAANTTSDTVNGRRSQGAKTSRQNRNARVRSRSRQAMADARGGTSSRSRRTTLSSWPGSALATKFQKTYHSNVEMLGGRAGDRFGRGSVLTRWARSDRPTGCGADGPTDPAQGIGMRGPPGRDGSVRTPRPSHALGRDRRQSRARAAGGAVAWSSGSVL